MDRFTALKVFCAVIEARSFTKAATNVGLSRSAISKNIRELEAHVGVRLVNRTTRGVTASEAGAHYYKAVSDLLRRHEAADDLATQSAQELRGTLRLTIPVTLGLHLVVPLLPKFSQENPEVSLDICMSEEKLELLEGNFDVAVRGSHRLEDSTLISRRIGSVSYVTCAAPQYLQQASKITQPGDLLDHPLIVHGANLGDEQWCFSKQETPCHVSVRAHHKSNCSEALRSLLVAGMGVARIPLPYVRQDIEQGHLQPLLEDWSLEPLSVYAVYPQSDFVPRRTRLFIDFLISSFKGT
ncbi:LysR family transcriptional regulator [Epibacterium ulvae]|uniref:LysR family transcriptional regulator n=1 Tax=Epibacterium ulvae TaxID=1156985 RepID=UPI002491E4D8|nr:LysR family transcriptional regulator [Epibacterium ulvae]